MPILAPSICFDDSFGCVRTFSAITAFSLFLQNLCMPNLAIILREKADALNCFISKSYDHCCSSLRERNYYFFIWNCLPALCVVLFMCASSFNFQRNWTRLAHPSRDSRQTGVGQNDNLNFKRKSFKMDNATTYCSLKKSLFVCFSLSLSPFSLARSSTQTQLPTILTSNFKPANNKTAAATTAAEAAHKTCGQWRVVTCVSVCVLTCERFPQAGSRVFGWRKKTKVAIPKTFVRTEGVPTSKHFPSRPSFGLWR